MTKAVKLADIAERVGVSTVTVSKALSGQKGVSEEVRERIKQLADEMGYVKSVSAAKTKDKKSYTLGVILRRRSLFTGSCTRSFRRARCAKIVLRC